MMNHFLLCAGLLAACLFGFPAGAQTPVAGAATEKTKPCFQCNATGSAKCIEPSCRGGIKDCPGPCLKLTKGVWEKREVPGHTDPNERWQKVYAKGGKKSGYWSSAHVGEVAILNADGSSASPKCSVCSGAATVTCPRCKGQGTMVCPLCDGKKAVPPSWSAFDHPKLKDRPRKFELKDGTTVIGRKTMISGDTVTLKTATGDVKVNQADIVSESAQ